MSPLTVSIVEAGVQRSDTHLQEDLLAVILRSSGFVINKREKKRVKYRYILLQIKTMELQINDRN